MALKAAFLVTVRAPAAAATVTPVQAAPGAGFAAVLRDVSKASVLPISARAQTAGAAGGLLALTQTGLAVQRESATGIRAAAPDTKKVSVLLVRPQQPIQVYAGSVLTGEVPADSAGQVAVPSAAPVLPMQKETLNHLSTGQRKPAAQQIVLPASAALAAVAAVTAPAPAVVPVAVSPRKAVSDHAAVAQKETHGAASEAAPSALLANQQLPLATPVQATPISFALSTPQAIVPGAVSQSAVQAQGKLAVSGLQAASLASSGTEITSAAAVSGETSVAPAALPHLSAGAPVRPPPVAQPVGAAMSEDDVPVADPVQTEAVAPAAGDKPVAGNSPVLPASQPSGSVPRAGADSRDASASPSGKAAPAAPQTQASAAIIASPLPQNAQTLPAASPSAGTAAMAVTPAHASSVATGHTPMQSPQTLVANRLIDVPATESALSAQSANQPAPAAPAASSFVPAQSAALPAAPVAAAQSVAPAQNSVATQQAKVSAPAVTPARPAARGAAASVQGTLTSFDAELVSDTIAPASPAPVPAVHAASVAKSVPEAAAQTAQAQAAPQPAAGQAAARHAAAPADGAQQPKMDASPASARTAKPGSADNSAAAATASAAPGATAVASVAAAVPAQAETASASPSSLPAQPAPAGTDVAAGHASAAPVAQLAQAVTSLHAGADGSSHVTIKLDPAELGQLQVRITRAADGTASVNVAVERPETLASLQGDLGHLHAALDRAGLPEQRSVTLHLAGSDQAGSQTLDAGAGGMSHGGSQQGARQERQPGSSFTPDYSGGAQPLSAPGETASQSRPATTSAVNITA